MNFDFEGLKKRVAEEPASEYSNFNIEISDDISFNTLNKNLRESKTTAKKVEKQPNKFHEFVKSKDYKSKSRWREKRKSTIFLKLHESPEQILKYNGIKINIIYANYLKTKASALVVPIRNNLSTKDFEMAFQSSSIGRQMKEKASLNQN